jgi:hypothetical protein
MIRHRRIHEQQQNGESVDNFSEEDLENDHDHLGSLEEESPEAEHAYLHVHGHAVSNAGMHHGIPASSDMVTMSPAMASMNTGGAVHDHGPMGGTMAPPMMVGQNY